MEVNNFLLKFCWMVSKILYLPFAWVSFSGLTLHKSSQSLEKFILSNYQFTSLKSSPTHLAAEHVLIGLILLKKCEFSSLLKNDSLINLHSTTIRLCQMFFNRRSLLHWKCTQTSTHCSSSHVYFRINCFWNVAIVHADESYTKTVYLFK